MVLQKEKQLENMIAWRRYLHAHPELSYKEYNTSQWLQNLVSSFGEYQIKQVGKTSFVAVIDGHKSGTKEVLAFRTDMDALPIEEETGLSFASTVPGVMHACGHDAHMAMLLGLAEWLGHNQEAFSNRVVLIFQSAEEVPPGGAVEMVQSGVLDEVAFVYGFHVFPHHPVGHIGIAEGAITASQDIIELEVFGKGTHGATPECGVDPILVGSELISSLHHIVSRNISAYHSAVLSFGEFHSGDIFNIIPDKAVIKGNVRTTDPEIRTLIKARVHEVVSGICQAHNAQYALNYIKGYSPVINDSKATEMAYGSALKSVGEPAIFSNPQKMVSEDFSEYTDRYTGCFMILGGGIEEDGYRYMNHHPKFDIDEKAMASGLAMYIQLVKDHSAL